MYKCLKNPFNTPIFHWILTVGRNRDFQYKLVRDKDYKLRVLTGDPRLDEMVEREILELRSMYNSGGSFVVAEVIKKCKNAV